MSGETTEAKSDNASIYEGADPNETFDNLDYESEASKETGKKHNEKFKDKIKRAKEATKKVEDEDDDEDEIEEKPKKKAEKVEKKDDKKKTELDTLSDKEDGVDDEDEKPKKKDDKRKPSDDKADDTESEDEEEIKALDKEKKGKVKVRIGDDLYGIEPESLVRYKVDGEWVERPLQQILNRASGEEALDKKFSDLGNQKKEFESQRTQVAKTQEFLKNTVGEIVGILKDPNKNPFDALSFLVEKSGEDPYTLWRRNIEASLDVVEQLQAMDENERKAFFLEKKDEFRTKADDARTKAWQAEQSNQQALQKADALRQAHGVSEEQFVEAWDELEAQGNKTPTDEQIVEYASIKPHLSTVQDILEAHEDKIDDTKYSKVVTDFARQMRAGEITKEQLIDLVAKEFMDEDLKDLTVRKKATEKKKETRRDEEKPNGKFEYESFDDFN